MPAVNPKILLWARETAGLTRQDAVAKIRIKDARGEAAIDRLAALERGEERADAACPRPDGAATTVARYSPSIWTNRPRGVTAALTFACCPLRDWPTPKHSSMRSSATCGAVRIWFEPPDGTRRVKTPRRSFQGRQRRMLRRKP